MAVFVKTVLTKISLLLPLGTLMRYAPHCCEIRCYSIGAKTSNSIEDVPYLVDKDKGHRTQGSSFVGTDELRLAGTGSSIHGPARDFALLAAEGQLYLSSSRKTCPVGLRYLQTNPP